FFSSLKHRFLPPSYLRTDQIIRITVSVISRAASQPNTSIHDGNATDRMPFPHEIIAIIAIMIGTATTPLITAVQNNMAIGSMLVVTSDAPPSVAAPTIE